MISVDRQLLVEARIANESKSVLTAYAVWFFLVFFECTGSTFNPGRLFMIVLTIGGFVVMLSGSALGALLAISAVIFLADLFLIPGMVERHRNELREKLSAHYAQVAD